MSQPFAHYLHLIDVARHGALARETKRAFPTDDTLGATRDRHEPHEFQL